MRATVSAILFLTLSVVPFGAAMSADLRPADDLPVPVALGVGEVRPIGGTAEMMGPARTPICDDVKVVTVVQTQAGPAFKGVSPGKTLCSAAAGAVGPRQVFEITVY